MFLHTGLGVQLKRKSTYPVFWVTWIRQCHPGRCLLIAVPAFGIPPKKHTEVSFVIFACWARTACWVPFSHHSHSSHPNHLQYQLQTQCRGRDLIPSIGTQLPELGPFPQSLPFLPFEPDCIFVRMFVYAMVAPMTNKSLVTTGWSRPATYLKL